MYIQYTHEANGEGMTATISGGAIPPDGRSRYDWPSIIRQARRRPGTWVLAGEQVPRSTASAIRVGKIKALRDRDGWHYAVTTRNTNGLRADIWVSATREETDAPASDD